MDRDMATIGIISFKDGKEEYQELASISKINFSETTESNDFCYSLKPTVSLKGDFTTYFPKETMKHFKKSLKLNHLSRKRAKKILMNVGFQRNVAEMIINDMLKNDLPRTELYLEQLIETNRNEGLI